MPVKGDKSHPLLLYTLPTFTPKCSCMTLYQPEQQIIPNEKNTSSIIAQARCAHCGEPCLPNEEQTPTFCCEGCQTVYQILDKNNLCDY